MRQPGVAGRKTEGGSGSFEWKHENSNQAATDNTQLSPMSVCVRVCCLWLLLLLKEYIDTTCKM